MSKINEVEKKIEILEGKLRMVTKQNWELKQSYEKSLNDGLSKLNILKKSMENERIKYLGLDKPETPKCLSSISYEDVLLNSIKQSPEFRDCIKFMKEGRLKELSINYNIKKLKELESEIQKIPGVGYTKEIDTSHQPSEEYRENVEKEMKKKDRVKLKEGYCYE